MAEGSSAKSKPGSSRKKKTKSRQKKEAWLNNTFIVALRKMKLVGLRQALKPGVHWAERIFYIIAFFVCLGFSAYLTVVTVQEYYANPIQHNFHEDQPIYRVPFPATTITGTSIMRNNAIKDTINLSEENYNAFFRGSEEFMYEGKKWTNEMAKKLLYSTDHFCEFGNSFATRANISNEYRSSRINLKAYYEWVGRNHTTLRDNKDDSDLRDRVVPFLKQKTLDCTQILAACLWEGEGRHCEELFVAVQTDVGTGCTFNRMPEEFLRKKQGFMSLFHQPEYSEEERNFWMKFKAENLDSISAKGVEDFIEMTYPRVQHHPGQLRGLSFLLLFDEDEESMDCPIVDSNGYLLAIHSPFEQPDMLKTGIAMPPKHEIFVKVKAELTIADEDIQSLEIDERKCYFQSEKHLKNFNVYTKSNCHRECLGRMIQKDCNNCTLLTLSTGQNELLCGPSDVKCVQKTTATMESGGYEKLCNDPVCYPPCTELEYDADATYLPYYKIDRLNFTNLVENVPKKESLVTSIAHITFGSDSVTTRERKMESSPYTLFGVLGGAWGMAMEFSVFTFFTILSGFLVLIFSRCFRKKEEDDEEMETRNCDEEPPTERTSGPEHIVEIAEEGESNVQNQTEEISEQPDEEHHRDSVVTFSTSTSDSSESSASKLTTEMELTDTPTQDNNDENEINNSSNSDEPKPEASASNARNPEVSKSKWALASKAKGINASNAGNPPVSRRKLWRFKLASKAKEETPEVSNSSNTGNPYVSRRKWGFKVAAKAKEENPEVSTSSNAGNPRVSKLKWGFKLPLKLEEENPEASNTSKSDSREENPQAKGEEESPAAGEENSEVANNSASPFQKPIDGDENLDELELEEL